MSDSEWRSKERGRRILPDPRRVAEFAEIGRRMDRERQDAIVQVDRILRETPRVKIGSLLERPEFRTAGALERLSEIVDVELTRDAQYAETVALLACSLAEALAPVFPAIHRRQLRARAWKDVGKRAEGALDAVSLRVPSLSGHRW